MNLNLAAFLSGLFLVPIALLWLGHRFRRRSAPAQQAFWGGVVGYCIAGTVAVIGGMIPPEAWVPGETVRGFIGYWGMLIVPTFGAAVAALRAGGASGPV